MKKLFQIIKGIYPYNNLHSFYFLFSFRLNVNGSFLFPQQTYSACVHLQDLFLYYSSPLGGTRARHVIALCENQIGTSLHICGCAADTNTQSFCRVLRWFVKHKSISDFSGVLHGGCQERDDTLVVFVTASILCAMRQWDSNRHSEASQNEL